ncbi:hypothetical protein GCM10007916_05460 [Psychromonas marina]|uniref:Tetratricopeptide repeat protein n=1 Tax=Psychromonas marina TaxID=88364 RepID=A0ABQ6DWF9_9GAMM|nr:hypothetical protein [Psychromonas marina]GLS89479.1 hypothetical protein GCM10007916_05460 [Psychromonas marina]
MSIINKMHKGLQANHDESPMLSSVPVKKQKKKVLLFALISLLLASSIGLSFLIYDKESAANNSEQPNQTRLTPVDTALPITSEPVVTKELEPATTSTAVTQKKVDDTPKVAVKILPVVQPELPVTAKVTTPKEATPNKVTTPAKQTPAKPVAEKTKAQVEPKKTAHLEIKKSVLTTSELADIHLKSAEKALAKGDKQLASQEKIKALNVKPDLHHVRESLALYYFSIGEQGQAKSLLQKGAVQYPEHSDFNLMLSRIALKNDQQKKAYLYLQQSPPAVEGHLDYHVSYAILAQKFKDYARSEVLFEGLLTQRPNNGRWRMSLAIAQDKLGKEPLAVENYRKALLQIDLSSNAKKYINQRLTYLANQ